MLRMINKYNIAELSLVDRPIETTHAGFGAVIPHHGADHERRYFRTENHDNFGEKVPEAPATAAANFEKT